MVGKTILARKIKFSFVLKLTNPKPPTIIIAHKKELTNA